MCTWQTYKVKMLHNESYKIFGTVYFNLHLGAVHSKRWSKYDFYKFGH